MNRIIMTCMVSLIGGWLFALLRMPIPWLLGPMIAVLAGSKLAKLRLHWPASFRDAGILIVGYSIGLSFTKEALMEIVRHLPSMLLMTASLMLFCSVVALLFSRLSGIDYQTMITASIPGGLAQTITLAEEFQNIDLTVVTFFQVTRLMVIIFAVPMLIFSPLLGLNRTGSALPAVHDQGTAWASLFPNIVWFAAVCVLCAWLGKKIKLPTAYMLGPIIGTAVVHLSGLYGPVLPTPILNLSQFMIGSYVGLMLKPGNLERKARTVSLAVLNGILLMAGSIGLSEILIRTHGLSRATGLLSMAPGGMDQMGIMAQEAGADLSMVTGYQTFRLLFIYFVVSSVLKVSFRRAAKLHQSVIPCRHKDIK